MDLEDYLEVCAEGQFYEFIGRHAVGPDYSRDTIKTRVITMLHDNNRAHWQNRYWQCMLQHFPTVANMMLDLKTIVNDPEDWKCFSHFVQRLESAFIFKHVVPAIMKQAPKVFIAPIHDSFLTVEQHTEDIRRIMLQEFQNLGLQPKVKVENCASEATYHGKLREHMDLGLSFWGMVRRKTREDAQEEPQASGEAVTEEERARRQAIGVQLRQSRAQETVSGAKRHCAGNGKRSRNPR